MSTKIKPRHRSLGVEVRQNATEIRSSINGETLTIIGTPIVYNSPYTVRDIIGEFTETMLPGVARSALDGKDDVRFLFNHQGMPLARSLAGTLRFTDTPTGLQIEADLDLRQSLASDLSIAIERGDVSQMSCAFTVARDTWNSANTERSIQAFGSMSDVSAVTYPASPTTSIALAKRMLMNVPAESRSRILRMLELPDLRAGKTPSASNAQQLAAAVAALNAVLAQADQDDIDEGSPDANGDGTKTGGGVGDGATVSVQDGTGTRSRRISPAQRHAIYMAQRRAFENRHPNLLMDEARQRADGEERRKRAVAEAKRWRNR